MGGGGGGREGGEGTETKATTTSTTATTTAASRDAEGVDNVATGASKDQKPALHVIVLGSGGGPLESNVTAFLVRSLSTGWSKGSVVAVDAGVHLSAISKILEKTQPARLGRCDDFPLPYTLTQGPFTGLEVPNATHTANAAHIHRSLIDTYLITHPHLDHISGFVVNTAGLPGSRPKRLAGLPSTIAAFKAHIFNNVIWPNLSDENNGAGLVTYMRLVEGGSPALGEGEGRGYLEICDGLAVKIWGVSHGHCIERHSHRGSGSVRHGSFDASTMGLMGVGMGLSSNPPVMSPRALAHHNSANTGLSTFLQREQRELDRMQGGGGSQVGTAAALSARKSSISGAGGCAPGESMCVYDSSAYFIRDVSTGREILIFGDVEPDSVSLSPRNQLIWQEAAPKIASGKLAAIFIECSYDDSQPVDRLYGHLTPKYIAEEMSVLADEVKAARSRLAMQSEMHGAAAMERSHSSNDKKKRKRESIDDQGLLSRRKAATPTPHGGQNATLSRSSSANYPGRLTPKTSYHSEDAVSPKTVRPSVYIPPTRSGQAPNNSNSHHAASTLSNDSARNSIDSAAWSASGGGGAMASVMSRGRSGSGSGGSYFDSPRLATPTAGLSLQDAGDNTLTTGPVTPLSMSNSGGGGSLPPPVMQTGAGGGGYRHEPPPQAMMTHSGISGRMVVVAVDGLNEDHDDPHHYHGNYAVGPLDDAAHHHHHREEEKFDPSKDYDVSMGMVPEEEEEYDDEKSATPRQRNGNGNHHHHGHAYLRHGYEDQKVKIEDVDEQDKDELIIQHEKKPVGGDSEPLPMPLQGLKVVIIHVKDKLNDGRKAEDVILEELLEHEGELRLGCEYMVSESGQDLYL